MNRTHSFLMKPMLAIATTIAAAVNKGNITVTEAKKQEKKVKFLFFKEHYKGWRVSGNPYSGKNRSQRNRLMSGFQTMSKPFYR